MNFVSWDEVIPYFRGKSVAIVGSAPSCRENEPGFIDSHDVVMRINNYKLGAAQGYNCDIHYSFFGTSIRKTPEELQKDGVKLCMCKCPDSKALESAWHEKNQKQYGIDFQYIYRQRKDWWFCDTFIPDTQRFLDKFEMLEKHIPTTGFSAILDVLDCEPAKVYITGFDFFQSGVHNVDEPWKEGDASDPIGHRPDLEARWLADNEFNYPMQFDGKLESIVNAIRSDKI